MKRKIQNKPAEKRRARGNPNWKKGGDSPNPGGRPAEEKEVVEACRQQGLKMVKLLVRAANRGNVHAQKEVLARGFGKLKQVVVFETPDGKPAGLEQGNVYVVAPDRALRILQRLADAGALPVGVAGLDSPDDAAANQVHEAGSDGAPDSIPSG